MFPASFDILWGSKVYLFWMRAYGKLAKMHENGISRFKIALQTGDQYLILSINAFSKNKIKERQQYTFVF